MSHPTPQLDASPAATARRIPLESIIATAELDRRPSRPRDPHVENHAMVELIDVMAAARGTAGADLLLQRLSELALCACGAGSAGVSILERDGDHRVFRWRAIAGQWSTLAGGSIPYQRSPCATVLERNAPVLMRHPERYYDIFGEGPPIAEVLLIPFHHDGEPVGTVWAVQHDEAHQFDGEDRRLLVSLSRFASTATQLLITQRLRDDLGDLRLLQTISAQLITQDDVGALYEKILDAAIGIMHSDSASLQMFFDDPHGGVLKLIAHRGFDDAAAAYWDSVVPTTHSPCGEVLRTRRRVIVEEISECPFMADSDELSFFVNAGLHSAQSSPLSSRSGRLVGVFSTHWRQVHVPSERDLRLLDILTRQAADLIERKLAEGQLVESDRRKDEFLATLAHELRNPLAPIRNAVEVLRMTDLPREDVHWARDVIDRQTRHLTHLVDDLLDVSRITRGRLELRTEPVDLATVIDAAVETTEPVLRQRDQTLSMTGLANPVIVEADPTRLAQVFANLLNNAAKFSEPGAGIELSVEQGIGEAVVRIRDHGVGIAADVLPRVFDLFSRLDAPLDRQAGLGIGLALVQRLVHMHHGRVSAASDGPGHGSEFVVELPLLARPANQPATADDAVSRALGPRRVLIVDDYQDGASSMCVMLERLGYETRAASDGLAGLEAAAEFRPDVALLDIGMPKLNGYELAERIRAEPWGTAMTLIAVTGWGQSDDKRRTAKAGFDHHLIKPVVPAELARLLAQSVELQMAPEI